MVNKFNSHKVLVGWIGIALLLISNIALVARWSGIAEQRMTSLEQQSNRLEQRLIRIESNMNRFILGVSK